MTREEFRQSLEAPASYVHVCEAEYPHLAVEKHPVPRGGYGYTISNALFDENAKTFLDFDEVVEYLLEEYPLIEFDN